MLIEGTDRGGPWTRVVSDLMSLKGDAVLMVHELGGEPWCWYGNPSVDAARAQLGEAVRSLDRALDAMREVREMPHVGGWAPEPPG